MAKSSSITKDDSVTIGGPIDRVRVSLRVFGDDLDPDEVSQLLNCAPSESYVKGEAIVSKRTGGKRIAQSGIWLLESDQEQSTELEEQILKLLERACKDLSAWEKITGKYKVDLFCGLFLEADNRESWFSPEVLGALAERRLSIGFDIYAFCDDAEGGAPV